MTTDGKNVSGADAVPSMSDVLIVGAGHGGAQVAASLRQLGFRGTVTLVGDEPDPPYERPPLSKDYLSGAKSFERILIRPRTFWPEKSVSLFIGRSVVGLDPESKTIAFADGAQVRYGSLVWATGGEPRRLTCSGHDLAGVHSVRSRADVDRLAAELNATSRVVVIGGGYIGLEAAAVLVKLGKSVTVVEAQDRVLARVAGEALSRFFESEHRRHGVDIRLGATVACIEERDGKASGVQLTGGEVLKADLVIVGIGVVPAVSVLLEAGAAGEDGVMIDAYGRTSLTDVYAVGDCARHANPYAPLRASIRLESVQNANDLAGVVARCITGQPKPYHATPWFWSHQYDLKLQTVGLSIDHDDVVIRGRPESGTFSVIYLRDGRVIALDCVNATRDYVQGRALVEAGVRVPPEALADQDLPLKSLPARAAAARSVGSSNADV